MSDCGYACGAACCPTCVCSTKCGAAACGPGTTCGAICGAPCACGAIGGAACDILCGAVCCKATAPGCISLGGADTGGCAAVSGVGDSSFQGANSAGALPHRRPATSTMVLMYSEQMWSERQFGVNSTRRRVLSVPFLAAAWYFP